ncbi:MAG: hypothetical protein ACRBN8_38015 [Nannocystales bacterium]
MTVGTDTLRAFERARWARQVEVLRAWLASLPDVEPHADALRCAFAGSDTPNAATAQMRFDLARDRHRLHAAIGGKTPSAVDPAHAYPSPEAFARDEAAHTLDNAVVFSHRALAAQTRVDCGAQVERAQRWIQRLRWELVDTGLDVALPLSLSADVVATDLLGAKRIIERVQTTLADVRERLTAV